MADKKISDLTALSSQATTDLYETSANGTGSFKETRAQQLSYINLNAFSPQNIRYVAKNGSDVTGTGTQTNPWASVSNAMTQVTGTSTNPILLMVAPGIYTSTNLAIKPYVSIAANKLGAIVVTNPITLDATWEGKSNAVAYFFDCVFGAAFNLLFDSFTTASTNSVAFFNSTVSGDFTAKDKAQGNIITFENGSNAVNINSYSMNFDFHNGDISGTIAGTGSVTGGDYEINIFGTNLGGDISLSDDGALSAATLKVYRSRYLGFLNIEGTDNTAECDLISYPRNGIVYSGGGASAQISVKRGDLGPSIPYVVTAGKILRANGTAYIPTTSTFADTYSASALLYANGANTVTGLTTANDSFLQTNGSGVPAWQNAGTTRTNLSVPGLATNNAFTAQNGITPVAITSSSAAVAWNLNTAPNATHTATENTTLSAPTNQVNGNIYILRFQQHASAAKTFAFNSTYKFPGGVVPIVSTGLSSVDIFTFRSDGTNMQCIGIAQNIS